MIHKFHVNILRNAEHFQFVTDACAIFSKHRLEPEMLSSLYESFSGLQKEEETALAVEKDNAKIREKGGADLFRDKLHRKLFNHVKAILYDETDPLFDAAQRVMAVIKGAGNPTQLAENAESAVLTTLGNKLVSHRSDLEAIGAQQHVDKLVEANHRFMQLEKECRDIASERAVVNMPSVADVRKRADVVYRNIVNAFNSLASIRGEALYQALIADVNTLVAKYDNLLAQRKGKKDDKSATTADNQADNS
jgi:hypothetical protein